MSQVTVAVLGTGKMGAPMARRLHEQGFVVRLWNRTRQRAEQVGIGEVCATPADAASGADVVITMLTDPKAVRATYFGEHGALEASGSPIYVDCSTVSPAAHEEIAQAAGRRDALFLEAPVLGSVPAAGAGKLLVLVGGDASVLATASPVLAALGDVRYIGALGTASRLKLVANSMLAVISEAAAELFNAGVRTGLDKERIWELLIRLAPLLDARKAGFVEGRYEPVNFRLADMVKDLDLALDVYREVGAETPLTVSTRDLFAKAREKHGELDLAAISELWRQPAAPRA